MNKLKEAAKKPKQDEASGSGFTEDERKAAIQANVGVVVDEGV